MAGGDLGALEMALNLNANIGGGVKKANDEIRKFSEGGQKGAQAFEKLFKQIKKAGEATKALKDGKEVTISARLSKSEVRGTINLIQSVANSYQEMFDKIENMKGRRKVLSNALQMDGLPKEVSKGITDELRQLDRLLPELESKSKSYRDIIAGFYKKNGDVNTKIVGMIDSSTLGELKRQVGLMNASAKQYENILNGMTARKNAESAIQSEYMKYSNLAKGSMMTIDKLAESARTRLHSSLEKFGETNESKALQGYIDKLESLKTMWSELIKFSHSQGQFPESIYRNAYLYQRQAMTELSIGRSKLGAKDFDNQKLISDARQKESDRRRAESDQRRSDADSRRWLNDYYREQQRVMSQNDKLIDSFNKLYEAQNRLSNVKVAKGDFATQQAVDTKMNELRAYAQQLQSVWDKIGHPLAFRGADGTSLVGANFKNLITDANSLAVSLENLEKARLNDAAAAEKQAQKAQEATAKNQIAQAQAGNKAWTQASDKTQIEGEKLRSAQLKQQMEERFKAQEEAEKKHQAQMDNLEKIRLQKQKEYQQYFANMQKATEQLHNAKYISDAKNEAQVNAERARQIERLTDVIRKLQTEQTSLGIKKYFDGTDTSIINSTRESINQLVSALQKYQEQLRNGGSLQDWSLVRTARKDALSEATIARQLTNQDEREKRALARQQAEQQRLNEQANASLFAQRIEAALPQRMDPAIRKSMQDYYRNLERESAASARKATKDDERYAKDMNNVSNIITSLNDKKALLDARISKSQEVNIDTTRLESAKKRVEELIESYKTLRDNVSKEQYLSMPGVLGNLGVEKKSTDSQVNRAIQSDRDALKAYNDELAKSKSEANAAEAASKAMAKSAANAINDEHNSATKLALMLEKIKHIEQDMQNQNNKAIKLGVNNSEIEQQLRYITNLRTALESLTNANVTSGSLKPYENELKQISAECGTLKTKLTSTFQSAEKATKDAEAASKKASQEVAKLVSQYRNLENAAKNASNAMSGIKDLLYQFAPIYGVQQLVMSVIEVGGEIEKQHIALQSIIGDIQQANDLFEGLKGLALQSPFTFGELTKDVKQLAAYNVETNQLYDTTKRLADISSGLGVSFDRIALAYGQVKSRSWLDAKELRQFAYAGVPLLQSLAEMYSQAQGKEVSKATVRKMITNRQVSFEDVQKVLWSMTDEGGKFYNMQMVLSETLLGRYNKLKDAWEIMLSGFAKGDSIVGATFKGILDFLTSILLRINAVIPAVTGLFAVFAINKLKNVGANLIQKGQTAEMRQQTILRMQQLVTEGKITQAEVSRLILEGKITQQEAVQLGLMRQQAVTVGRLGLAMKGLGSMAKGLWAAMGGWVGLIITGVAAAASYAYTRYSDMKQAGEKALEEFSGKAKTFSEFQSGMSNRNPSTTAEKQKELEEYVNFIKENAPYLTTDILFDLGKLDGVDAKLAKIKKWVKDITYTIEHNRYSAKSFAEDTVKSVEILRDSVNDRNGAMGKVSQLLAKENDDTIEQMSANIVENAKKSTDAIIKHYAYLIKQAQNIKEKRAILGQYLSTQNDRQKYVDDINLLANTNNTFSLSSNSRDLANANSNIDAQIEKIAEQIRSRLGKGIKNIGKEGGENITALYRTMLESAFEGMDDDSKAFLSLKIDKILKIDGDARVSKDIIDKLMAGLDNPETTDEKVRNFMLHIADKIRHGSELNDAEKKKVTEIMNSAKKDLEARYPDDVDRVIKDLLASSHFVARIKMQVDDDSSELDKMLWGEDLSVKQSQLLKELTKDNDLVGAKKKAKEQLEEQQNTLKNVDTTPGLDVLQKNIMKNEIQSKIDDLNYLINHKLGKYVDPKGKTKHEGPDKELKALRSRIQNIKKLIALYKEYRKDYGDFEAQKRVNKTAKEEGIEGYDFGDPVGSMEKAMKEAWALYNKKKTEERKEFARTTQTEKEDEARKKEHETVESLAKAYKLLNDQLKAQYELREAIQKKYGDQIASTMTSGKLKLGESYEKSLTEQLEDLISKSDHKEVTIDMALGADNKQLNDWFGEGTKLREIIEDLRTERQRIQKAAVDAVVAQLDTLEGQIPAMIKIVNDYEDAVNKIERWDVRDKQGNIDQKKVDMRDKALEIAKLNRDTKLLQNSRDYNAFFAGNRLMSDTEASAIGKRIGENLEKRLKSGSISPKAYAEEIRKVRDTFAKMAYNDKGLFGNNTDASIFLKSGLNGLLEQKKEDTDYALDNNGKDSESYKNAKESEDSIRKLVNSFNAISDALSFTTSILDGFSKAAQDMIDMFEALGNDAAAEQWKDIQTGINTVTSVLAPANNIVGNALQGNVGGIVGSAISAPFDMITSPITMWAKRHDEKLEKQINELKNTNAILDHLTNIIKENLERYVGKLYSYSSFDSNEPLKKLSSQLKEYRYNLATGKKEAVYKGQYSDETRKKYEEARKSGSYFDTQMALMYAERDNYLKMADEERGKKDTDDQKVEEYMNSYEEAERKIKKFVRDMANELYSIDFDGWSKNIASALVDAWQAGTNSVKAYKNAVKDAMKNVITDVVQQKVIGTYIDSFMDDWLKEFETADGIMNTSLYASLAGFMGGLEDKIGQANSILNVADGIMKSKGFGSMKDIKSSLSSGIQETTEDTADLRVSYMNAIRADVSLNRTYLQKMYEETMPSINSNISMSLVQLRSIRASIEAMGANVADIKDILDDSSRGTRPMYVKINAV